MSLQPKHFCPISLQLKHYYDLNISVQYQWDPKKWGENIWSGSSDSEIELEFDPDFKDWVVTEAQPLIQMVGQQEQTDGGVQIMCTYTLKDLWEFLEIYHKRVVKTYWHGICELGVVELHLSIY